MHSNENVKQGPLNVALHSSFSCCLSKCIESVGFVCFAFSEHYIHLKSVWEIYWDGMTLNQTDNGN